MVPITTPETAFLPENQEDLIVRFFSDCLESIAAKKILSILAMVQGPDNQMFRTAQRSEPWLITIERSCG